MIGPAYLPFGARRWRVTRFAGGTTRKLPSGRVRTALALPVSASAITSKPGRLSLPLIGFCAAAAMALVAKSRPEASRHAATIRAGGGTANPFDNHRTPRSAAKANPAPRGTPGTGPGRYVRFGMAGEELSSPEGREVAAPGEP